MVQPHLSAKRKLKRGANKGKAVYDRLQPLHNQAVNTDVQTYVPEDLRESEHRKTKGRNSIHSFQTGHVHSLNNN
ncbi:hypothetical protein PilKf_01312 [Pillotina sp. SPG140]|jgi:hypothetical protein